MDVAVDAARGDDQVFASDDLGRGPDDELSIDSIHRVGIPGLADFYDAAILDANVRLDDPPVIENDCVRDDQVERAVWIVPDRAAGLRTVLAHAVANHLATTESDLIAVVRRVSFHFDD